MPTLRCTLERGNVEKNGLRLCKDAEYDKYSNAKVAKKIHEIKTGHSCRIITDSDS